MSVALVEHCGRIGRGEHPGHARESGDLRALDVELHDVDARQTEVTEDVGHGADGHLDDVDRPRRVGDLAPRPLLLEPDGALAVADRDRDDREGVVEPVGASALTQEVDVARRRLHRDDAAPAGRRRQGERAEMGAQVEDHAGRRSEIQRELEM